MSPEAVRVDRGALAAFCQQVFERLGLAGEDAGLAAEVLVAADARGIPSHGVARLWRYVNGLQTGKVLPDAPPEVVRDTPTSVVIDAHGAMGAPVSARTMARII